MFSYEPGLVEEALRRYSPAIVALTSETKEMVDITPVLQYISRDQVAWKAIHVLDRLEVCQWFVQNASDPSLASSVAEMRALLNAPDAALALADAPNLSAMCLKHRYIAVAVGRERERRAAIAAEEAEYADLVAQLVEDGMGDAEAAAEAKRTIEENRDDGADADDEELPPIRDIIVLKNFPFSIADVLAADSMGLGLNAIICLNSAARFGKRDESGAEASSLKDGGGKAGARKRPDVRRTDLKKGKGGKDEPDRVDPLFSQIARELARLDPFEPTPLREVLLHSYEAPCIDGPLLEDGITRSVLLQGGELPTCEVMAKAFFGIVEKIFRYREWIKGKSFVRVPALINGKNVAGGKDLFALGGGGGDGINKAGLYGSASGGSANATAMPSTPSSSPSASATSKAAAKKSSGGGGSSKSKQSNEPETAKEETTTLPTAAHLVIADTVAELPIPLGVVDSLLFDGNVPRPKPTSLLTNTNSSLSVISSAPPNPIVCSAAPEVAAFASILQASDLASSSSSSPPGRTLNITARPTLSAGGSAGNSTARGANTNRVSATAAAAEEGELAALDFMDQLLGAITLASCDADERVGPVGADAMSSSSGVSAWMMKVLDSIEHSFENNDAPVPAASRGGFIRYTMRNGDGCEKAQHEGGEDQSNPDEEGVGDGQGVPLLLRSRRNKKQLIGSASLFKAIVAPIRKKALESILFSKETALLSPVTTPSAGVGGDDATLGSIFTAVVQALKEKSTKPSASRVVEYLLRDELSSRVFNDSLRSYAEGYELVSFKNKNGGLAVLGKKGGVAGGSGGGSSPRFRRSWYLFQGRIPFTTWSAMEDVYEEEKTHYFPPMQDDDEGDDLAADLDDEEEEEDTFDDEGNLLPKKVRTYPITYRNESDSARALIRRRAVFESLKRFLATNNSSAGPTTTSSSATAAGGSSPSGSSEVVLAANLSATSLSDEHTTMYPEDGSLISTRILKGNTEQGVCIVHSPSGLSSFGFITDLTHSANSCQQRPDSRGNVSSSVRAFYNACSTSSPAVALNNTLAPSSCGGGGVGGGYRIQVATEIFVKCPPATDYSAIMASLAGSHGDKDGGGAAIAGSFLSSTSLVGPSEAGGHHNTPLLHQQHATIATSTQSIVPSATIATSTAKRSNTPRAFASSGGGGGNANTSMNKNTSHASVNNSLTLLGGEDTAPSTPQRGGPAPALSTTASIPPVPPQTRLSVLVGTSPKSLLVGPEDLTYTLSPPVPFVAVVCTPSILGVGVGMVLEEIKDEATQLIVHGPTQSLMLVGKRIRYKMFASGDIAVLYQKDWLLTAVGSGNRLLRSQNGSLSSVAPVLMATTIIEGKTSIIRDDGVQINSVSPPEVTIGFPGGITLCKASASSATSTFILSTGDRVIMEPPSSYRVDFMDGTCLIVDSNRTKSPSSSAGPPLVEEAWAMVGHCTAEGRMAFDFSANRMYCTFESSTETTYTIDAQYGGLRAHDSRDAYHVTPFMRTRHVTKAIETASLPTDLTVRHNVDVFVESPEVINPLFEAIVRGGSGVAIITGGEECSSEERGAAPPLIGVHAALHAGHLPPVPPIALALLRELPIARFPGLPKSVYVNEKYASFREKVQQFEADHLKNVPPDGLCSVFVVDTALGGGGKGCGWATVSSADVRECVSQALQSDAVLSDVIVRRRNDDASATIAEVACCPLVTNDSNNGPSSRVATADVRAFYTCGPTSVLGKLSPPDLARTLAEAMNSVPRAILAQLDSSLGCVYPKQPASNNDLGGAGRGRTSSREWPMPIPQLHAALNAVRRLEPRYWSVIADASSVVPVDVATIKSAAVVASPTRSGVKRGTSSSTSPATRALAADAAVTPPRKAVPTSPRRKEEVNDGVKAPGFSVFTPRSVFTNPQPPEHIKRPPRRVLVPTPPTLLELGLVMEKFRYSSRVQLTNVSTAVCRFRVSVNTAACNWLTLHYRMAPLAPGITTPLDVEINGMQRPGVNSAEILVAYEGGTFTIPISCECYPSESKVVVSPQSSLKLLGPL